MLGHTSPEILFKVYSRYIPNKTRRDGSAFASRMGGKEESAQQDGQSLNEGERKQGSA
jgi:integrase